MVNDCNSRTCGPSRARLGGVPSCCHARRWTVAPRYGGSRAAARLPSGKRSLVAVPAVLLPVLGAESEIADEIGGGVADQGVGARRRIDREDVAVVAGAAPEHSVGRPYGERGVEVRR